MDSTAPLPLSSDQETPPPPPPPLTSQDIAAAATPQDTTEDPASGDDGFETASDPDDDETGIPEAVSIENPNPELNSMDGVVGAEEKEPLEASSVVVGSVDESVGAESEKGVGGVEDNGAIIAGTEKKEESGDLESEAAALEPVAVGVESDGVVDSKDEKFGNSVDRAEVSKGIEVVSTVHEERAESKLVEVGPDAAGDVLGVDGAAASVVSEEIAKPADSKPVEVVSEAAGDVAGGDEASVPVDSEEVANRSDSKPVEVGSEAAGDVDGGDEAAVPVDSKEVAGPVVERTADSKAVEVVSEATGAVDGVEETIAPVEVGSEAAGVVSGVDAAAVPVDSKEVTSSVIEGPEDSKPVEEEIVTSEAAGSTESKAVDLEVEKDGDVYSAASDQILEVESRSQSLDAESSVVDTEEPRVEDSTEVKSSSADIANLTSTESKESGGAAKGEEGLEGGSVTVASQNVEDSGDKLDAKISNGDSVSADSEVAKDSAGKHDVMNNGDAADGVASMKNEGGAVEAEPETVELISVQEVESTPTIEEESKSREVEPVIQQEADSDAVGVAAATPSDDNEKMDLGETEEEEESSVSEGPARVAILESSEAAKQIIKEMEEVSTRASSQSGFRSSEENSQYLDGQIVSDSDEEVDTDEESEGRELFDSAALTALLKAATGASSDGGITITSQDATRSFSVHRPAGLGSSIPALKPAPPRSSRPSAFTPADMVVVGEPESAIDEEEKKLQEKVEQIRVKFLRLVQRLGHSPEDTVAAQVLYRLGLAEGIRRRRQINRLFSIETAKKRAVQLEEEKEDLDFSCNILVIGKTGVGKSATINSIFGEGKSRTNPFEPATSSVREISGIVDGVKIRILDTPGLRSSVMDQAANKKILLAIKKYTKRCPPDIVLYVDRMDTQTRDFNDFSLLRSITSILGSSIWFNAIVALTHSASAPPDGPNGTPLSYEVFIEQRSHVVQHSIRQAAGDMRLMNPIALVENHPSCRRNREGERVLPNGLSWRPQLLLLCYSSKILSEANALLKLQDPSPGKLFGFRVRSLPLPYLLSSLLQSRAHPKLSTDQGGDNGDSDVDLDDLSDTEQEEEEDEYDQLPPFKPLKKSQLAKLTKEQKKAYLDEYDYRVKLLQKKQWKEELRRMKEMKKKGKNQPEDVPFGDVAEDFDQDGAPAALPVPLPDMVLPPSFDCNNPVYRYRFLEPTSQLLIRPVFDSHGWDHDCGYDGVSIEESLAIAGMFPAGVAVQITKDKKDFSIHLDSSISAKHGENGSTLAGFDIQSIGKQLAYICRGETKFKNLKKNKTAAGVSVTFLGESVATGLKIEDQLSIGKRVGLVATAGAVRAQGDMAYGANLEARLKDADYPVGQALTTLGLSLMRWRSDLALGANLQSQFSAGRSSKVAVRVGLNNKLTGQVTVRVSTSEQLQIALVGVVSLALSLFRSLVAGESYMAD